MFGRIRRSFLRFPKNRQEAKDSHQHRLMVLVAWLERKHVPQHETVAFFCGILSDDWIDGTEFDIRVLQIIEDDNMSLSTKKEELLKLKKKYAGQ